MKRRRSVQHGMQGVFVFVLLGLFALMSTLLVLFGAQMYRGTVTHSESNNTNRVLTSYVRSMIRAEDAQDAISIEEMDGVSTIAMREYIGDIEYITRIYGYDGALYEQFTAADRPFKAVNGTKIIEISSFTPKLENGLLTVEMTDAKGEEILVQTAIRSEF